MKWIKAQVDDEVHRWLRVRAAMNDQNISEAITDVLREAYEQDEKQKQ